MNIEIVLVDLLKQILRDEAVTHSLHPSSKHLIGCNKHDADDECNGEGTDQALSHTCVFDLLHWTCYEDKERQNESKYLNPMYV